MVRNTPFLLALIALLALAAPAVAQDATDEGMPEMEVPENAIVSGLNFPRGLAYGEDGTLYIAEAGSGGATVVMEVEGDQITAGPTSQVTALASDGSTSVVLGNYISAFLPFEGASLGIQRAVPQGDSIWLVLSDHQNMTPLSDAVVEVDAATGRIKNFIELFLFEAANNPDATEEIYSNPSDIAWGADGTLYIVDTGANALYSWTADDGLALVHAWTDLGVPTAIEVGSNGDIWIGFLGAGIAPGAARIEHWSADASELIETFDGLTAITDILVDDNDNVYAVQIVEFGEQGPVPNSGALLHVTADGATPVAEGLPSPFGVAQAPDGSFVVSVNSAFAAPGSGAVVSIPAAM